MLIKFGVENHLSIASRQELSFVASSLKDQGAALIPVPRLGISLLPAAVIYGANASGKSNFISALAYFVQCVRHSHQRGSPEGGVPRTPFLLDPNVTATPSKFDIDFILDGVRYNYGFSANDNSFLDEWLYAFPAGKRQTWFQRGPKRKRFYFGKNLRGSTRAIESLTRSNSLFLSAAAQNANKQLLPIYRYLTNISFLFGIESESRAAIVSFREGKCDPRIISFLKNADTGITDFKFNDEMKEPSTFGTKLMELLKEEIPELKEMKDDPFQHKAISLGHAGYGNNPVFFDLQFESAGTIRLLILLKSIFSAVDGGTLLVIDELDASLHTYLSEAIVALFNSAQTNTKGAQLIATTHDTNLLGGTLLRRDQIWFSEKDSKGATALYPLTDIRTRNTDDIEKGYLEGRFGAVPYRGHIQSLIGSNE
jgi:AAA15 family ATPase/GTPase